MRTKVSLVLPLIALIGMLGSCATSDPTMEGFSWTEKKYIKLCPPKTKRNHTILRNRLGITPLYCDIPSIGILVADTVGTSLLDSEFEVVERTYLANILQEQGLSLSGATGRELDYAKVGKISNVDYLLVGTVGATDRSYVSRGFGNIGGRAGSYTEYSGASVRIVDVTTGGVIVSIICQAGDWKSPTRIGEAIGTSIKKALRGIRSTY